MGGLSHGEMQKRLPRFGDIARLRGHRVRHIDERCSRRAPIALRHQRRLHKDGHGVDSQDKQHTGMQQQGNQP